MGKEKNLSESLRYIYERFGIEVFLNDKKLYSLLSDLIPNKKMEINWVIDAVNIGAVKPLVESKKNNLDREECKSKMISIFKSNEINKDRTMYIVNCFYYSIKWTDKIITLEDIKEQRKKENLKNTKEKLNKNEKNKSEKNTKTQSKNTTINNTQNKKTNTKNTTSDTTFKSWKEIPENKARLNTLQTSYDSLYNIVEGFIIKNQSNVTLNLTASNYFNLAVSGLIILISVIILISYLLLLKEGYSYKKILFLDLVGIIICVKLIIGKANDFKMLKDILNKKKILNKFVALKKDLELSRNNIKLGMVSGPRSCMNFERLFIDYNNKFNDLNQTYKNSLSSKNTINMSHMKILVVVTILIFLISGIFESKLLYNGNTFVHKISRNIVSQIGSHNAKNGCVVVSEAYIREKPDLSAQTIINKVKDDCISLTGMEHNDGLTTWYEVELGYDKGWIEGNSISVAPKKLTISESAANVRSGPSLTSSVIKVYNEGTILYTTGKIYRNNEKEWYEVYLNGQRGYWISSKVVGID